MVIVRAISKANKVGGTHSLSSTDDQMRRNHRFGKRIDSDASLSSGISGSNVEICQMREEICAVPIELFEMPDLKKILSLETWNFCLSEDERESLCAYLPNLDEATFRQTLKELFEGENFHFGSPMAELFHRLKGGLCHPLVARYKEGLKYIERKQHYHSLRKYHNRMVNQFLEMQNLWQNLPHASLEERIELWHAWKLKKDSTSPIQFDEKTPSLKTRQSAGKTGKILNGKGLDEIALAERVSREISEINIISTFKEGGGFADANPDKEIEKADNKLSSKGMHLEHRRVQTRSRLLQAQTSEIVPSSVKRRGNDYRGGGTNLLNDSAICNISASDIAEKSLKKGNALESAGKCKQPKQYHGSRAGRIVRETPLSRIRSKKDMKCMENFISNNEMLEIEENPEVSPMEEIERQEGPRNTFRRSRTKVKSINKDGTIAQKKKHMQGTGVGNGIHILSEQQSQKVDESINNVGIDKKSRRRIKIREKIIEEESQEAAPNTAESDEIALALNEEENFNHLDTGDKKGTHGKLTKKHSKKKSKDDGNESPSSFVDAISVPEKIASGKASKRPVPPTIPAVVRSLPFSVIHLLSAVRTAMTFPMFEQASELSSRTERATETLHRDSTFMMPPAVHYSESNVQVLSCDNILDIKSFKKEGKPELSGVAFSEIVKRVQANPGDPRILEIPEPLQGIVRGVLRVLSSKTSPPKIKGWKPFVSYNKEARVWIWIGPVPPLSSFDQTNEASTSADTWGVSEKNLLAIQEFFANWLKHAQDALQQLGQLSLPPPPQMPLPLDMKERFRDLKAQKSLATISPSSEEMRAYFQKEELIRYAVPDRAFAYTTADGQKSVVAPIKRIGGKPNAKVRDHIMLNPDRPSHVTLLCLVRDAAARLPGAIGTRADVCALIRDSQYLVEDVSDGQLNQVVSGALDRLHYERDPCIRFDGERKLWVYLHTHRDEEDFEDDGTSSAKRWKRSKKEGHENQDPLAAQDYLKSGKDDQDVCNIGLDFNSSSCFEEPNDFSVYSTERPDLVYNNQVSTLGSPLVLGNDFPEQGRDDGALPFIDLPPSIQPPFVNMQQSHPMGWEVLGSSWNQGAPFHPHITF